MSNTDFLGRAIDTVKKAIDLDIAGTYDQAFRQYCTALELFMLALKWEKDARSKEVIRSKTGEYMPRHPRSQQLLWIHAWHRAWRCGIGTWRTQGSWLFLSSLGLF